MRAMIRAWFGYVSVAGLFGTCINLIYLVLPLYMMVVYDKVLHSYTPATLYALGIGVLVSLAVMAQLDFLKRKMMIRAARGMAIKMYDPVIRAMYANPEYDRGLEDLETVRQAVADGKMMWPAVLPWMVLYGWGLLLVHPWVGSMALCSVVLASCAQGLLYFLEKRHFTLADVAFHTNAGQMRGFLSNRLLVRGMGMLPAMLDRYGEQDRAVGRYADRAMGAHALIGSFTRLIHHLGLAAVFSAGVFAFFKEEITAGAIIAAVLMAARLFGPLEEGLEGIKEAVAASGALKRLKSYLPGETLKEKFSLPEPKGELAVEGAGLAVRGKGILNNINFELTPGQFLGIVGPASCGKTALCRVILGSWPLSSGKIRLDGAEIRQWPEEELGRYVGYLPQEVQLFEGTVAENIARMGNVDSEKVVSAAKKAGIHEMILKLPGGYDTIVTPGGVNLSGNQQQLISLARAVYGDPKLVVLDYPHSFLDDMGFRDMVGCLNQLKQEKITVVMVTDKTNLLAGCDKVLVIKDGQSAMYGPARDVMAQLTGQSPAASGV